MANIILNLSFSLEKRHGFVLRITEKGKSNGLRVTVKGLQEPDFTYWNKKEQRFVDASESAIHNNNVLQDLKQSYQWFINNCFPQSPMELKQMVETGKQISNKQVLTLGYFLRTDIEKMRQGNNKKPSKHYQNYINLLHKLEAEGQIINVPLADICNSHFKQFGQFILSLSMEEGKSNYIAHMRRFKTVHQKAYNAELNENLLTYKYADDAPTVDSKKRIALTQKQYAKFVKMDLSTIPQGGCNPAYYKELYRDYCIFLYEMKIRPADAIRLRHDNIVLIGEQQTECVRYIPEKKKNYAKTDKKVLNNRLTNTAKSIIKKYTGKSSKGYIFPFAMNEYDWDLDNATSWGKWNNRKQATMELVRAFLKKTAKHVGIKPEDFILYTFRHSAITHEVDSNKKSPTIIAYEAGTSLKMIENNYLNYVATL